MPKTRIRNLNKNFQFKDWMETSLQQDPPLDYFSFANLVGESEVITNSQYGNLLDHFSKNQSNKLIGIVLKAQSNFKSRNTKTTDFSVKYKQYWQQNQQRQLDQKQREAVVTLNRITCDNLVKVALQMNQLAAASTSSSTASASAAASSSTAASSTAVSTASQTAASSTAAPGTTIIKFASDFQDDSVASLGIIDLTIPDVRSFYHKTTADIPRTTPDNLTSQATDLLALLASTSPSMKPIKQIIAQAVSQDFDLVEQCDAHYTLKTVQHFVDLMESPSSPLLEPTLERETAVLTTIYLLNCLFLSVNDLIKLNWIERETAAYLKRKWDGIIINKETASAIGLIEFSGGMNCSNELKQQQDTLKLYTNLKKIVEDRHSTKKTAFAVRFFGSTIYFEQLLLGDHGLLRLEIASFKVPTTPRLLITYTKEIPKILSWKNRILNDVL